MNPKITLIVESEQIDEATVEKALGTAGSRIERVGETRSVGSAATKAFKWILEFTGDAAKAGDKLIEQATKELAGAAVKIQIDSTVIEVSNVNRSQVIEVMEKAQQVAQQAKSL